MWHLSHCHCIASRALCAHGLEVGDTAAGWCNKYICWPNLEYFRQLVGGWSRQFLVKKYREEKEKSWMVTELNRTVKAYPVSSQHDTSFPWFIITVPHRWFNRTDFTDWYFVLRWDASLHEVGNVKEYRGVRVCASICPHLVRPHWTAVRELQRHLTLEATCIDRSAHWLFRHPVWQG